VGSDSFFSLWPFAVSPSPSKRGGDLRDIVASFIFLRSLSFGSRVLLGSFLFSHISKRGLALFFLTFFSFLICRMVRITDVHCFSFSFFWYVFFPSPLLHVSRRVLFFPELDQFSRGGTIDRCGVPPLLQLGSDGLFTPSVAGLYPAA